jgi:hypothetical protein
MNVVLPAPVPPAIPIVIGFTMIFLTMLPPSIYADVGRSGGLDFPWQIIIKAMTSRDLFL